MWEKRVFVSTRWGTRQMIAISKEFSAINFLSKLTDSPTNLVAHKKLVAIEMRANVISPGFNPYIHWICRDVYVEFEPKISTFGSREIRLQAISLGNIAY